MDALARMHNNGFAKHQQEALLQHGQYTVDTLPQCNFKTTLMNMSPHVMNRILEQFTLPQKQYLVCKHGKHWHELNQQPADNDKCRDCVGGPFLVCCSANQWAMVLLQSAGVLYPLHCLAQQVHCLPVLDLLTCMVQTPSFVSCRHRDQVYGMHAGSHTLS